jgi:hypothetical protein
MNVLGGPSSLPEEQGAVFEVRVNAAIDHDGRREEPKPNFLFGNRAEKKNVFDIIFRNSCNVPRLSFCVPEMSDVSRNMLDVYAYKEEYLRMILGSIFKVLKVAFL